MPHSRQINAHAAALLMQMTGLHLSDGGVTGKDASWQVTPGVNMQVAYSCQHMQKLHVPNNISHEAVQQMNSTMQLQRCIA